MPKHQTTRERVYKQTVRAGGRGVACSLPVPLPPSTRLQPNPGAGRAKELEMNLPAPCPGLGARGAERSCRITHNDSRQRISRLSHR